MAIFRQLPPSGVYHQVEEQQLSTLNKLGAVLTAYEKLQVAYCAFTCESRRSYRVVRARSTSIRSIPTSAPSRRVLHPDGSVNQLLYERSFIRSQ